MIHCNEEAPVVEERDMFNTMKFNLFSITPNHKFSSERFTICTRHILCYGTYSSKEKTK